MNDLYERLEAIERQLERADRSHDTRITTGSLILAITGLLEIVKQQHEQIVDLNSRVEYGYTHREKGEA